MIIRKDGNFEINPLFPNEDWYNEGNYVVDETTDKGKEIVEKIKKLYPNHKLIIKNEEIIDIVEDIEKSKQQELNYIVVENTPNDIEIQFAEYILATEDRITNLEKQLGGM